MTYFDYYLRFADQASADAVLAPVNDVPRYFAIDTIGTVYKPTGVMLDSGRGSYPEMAPIPGWHVNVRHDAPAPELAQYDVAPAAPIRVWA